MLDAFRPKDFNLEPIFASWGDPPRFLGKPKKDPPVDTWLGNIKAGCVERKVPKEYWHEVGEHYLGDKARGRLAELKAVLRNLHGGKYRWNWKRFKIAMRNMAWEIDEKLTEWVKVQSKPSGLWWIVGRKDRHGALDDQDKNQAERKSEKRKSTVSQVEKEKGKRSTVGAKSLTKKTEGHDSSPPRRWLSHSHFSGPASTNSGFWNFASHAPFASRDPVPVEIPGDVTTTVVHVPRWLVKASNAFDNLANEHPKVMTTLSAVLITVGSLSGVAAGSGGAIFSSQAAQAAGTIVVGVGNLLKTSQDGAAAREVDSQPSRYVVNISSLPCHICEPYEDTDILLICSGLQSPLKQIAPTRCVRGVHYFMLYSPRDR
ncbi:hypothetical protein BV25DRAFT_1794360 [Artomyces pyxidatus]|uniref:Uncharacterized protein n=1 Tax=Artomyces pyxidatus TaxID=48021 RepID=A0ACB8TGQ3_9AGAM|nr:hypothetical protein BV25DRAFT_1794360 [Artomyces pyxidatus]